jgi:hypothetical protein
MIKFLFGIFVIILSIKYAGLTMGSPLGSSRCRQENEKETSSQGI